MMDTKTEATLPDEAHPFLKELEDQGVARLILDRLNAIEDKLDEPHPLVACTLWKLEQVAQYMNTTEPTARRILKQPGAPRPVQVPTSQKTVLPDRFEPEEIRTYCFRMRRKRAR